MINDGRRPAKPSRDQLLQQIVQIAVEQVPELPGPDRVLEFLRHYFKHAENSVLLTRPAQQIVRSLLCHLQLAYRRAPGESHLDVHTPSLEQDGWEAGGHTVLTLVTDDKAWLVDTVSLAVNAQGWSVREIIHPQFHAIRDAEGKLRDMAHRREGRPTIAEAWLWLELYPPLGSSAEDAKPDLMKALHASLSDLDAATTDQKAMHDRLVAAAQQAEDVPDSDALLVAEMLMWLADDRFLLLGARDFTLTTSDNGNVHFEPKPGGLGILRGDQRAARSFNAAPRQGELLVITKDSDRSRVRRANHMDYLGLHLAGVDGEHVERRFLGLFAASALTESVLRVPMLRGKALQIADAIGYDPDSYGGRAVAAAIEAHPRDELLQSGAAELTPIIAEIADQDDPRQVISYFRVDAWGRFLTALIYFPRERYNTTVRQRLAGLLMEVSGAESFQWSALVSESPLARLYFTLKLPPGQMLPELDQARLRQAIEEATRDWEDRFIEIAERMDSAQRGVEWSDGYKEDYTPVEAINDLVALNQVSGSSDMAQIMYVPVPPEDGVDFRLKMLRVDSEMVLSEIMPHLASLGVDVIDERPFQLELRGQEAHIYDFGLRLPGGAERLDGWSYEARARFTSAVAASYAGLGEADGLNRMVTDSWLTWQQVSVLRAVSRYLRQHGTTYSQPYIAATLHKYKQITTGLVRLFEAKFDPWLDPEVDRALLVEERADRVRAGLEQVSALDEDRMLRQFLSVLLAVVRTNYYQLDDDPLPSGTPRPGRGALAFKLSPGGLDFVDDRQPKFEIFVYSPQVEGVHLRYGPIARGGIRWSDRAEDYRTEVLDLVRAQTVKNAIIVPVGAKGGFYPKLLGTLSPADRLSEARASYASYIKALLSVTDSIVDGQPVHPDRVVAWDGYDPYLVVAADKGTATFSDLANRIAVERGFWLGDAFASGGSAGYDHKGMGITARGAWVSVQRHFGEMGIDDQADDFTCVGIGDMSGDVFGNGLLRSRHIRLVAAFNHTHIFIDPDPDPETSYLERERLFRLPRSGWDDYRPDLITAGGGVHLRSAKTIPVGDEVRRALGLDDAVTELTPNEMIQAILRAPVDLMWNGGIGTWVKATDETHAQVGDRSNDQLRVDANTVRARCVAEGGNLGWTQAARVEYALAGGRINTDFIDNSAGVDTSDHEVNIKILLDAEVTAGRLDRSERDRLLHQMTEEVAELVLDHNVAQNLALANSLATAHENAGVHEQLMATLERSGQLVRRSEGLPSSETLAARTAHGRGLVGPELAMLLATVKHDLAEAVLASELPDDPYLADRLVKYFPTPLRDRFGEQMLSHPLARQIITTVAVNRFVDSQGISAAHRLRTETGATTADVMRAQLTARNLMDAGWLETTTTNATDMDAATKTMLRVHIRRLVERACRWLLQEHRHGIDIEGLVAELKPGTREVIRDLPELLAPAGRECYEASAANLVELGVRDDLARRMASWQIAHLALPIVRVAGRHRRDVGLTARVYFGLSERLGIDQALTSSQSLPRTGRWEIMARASVRDELINVQAAIAADALEMLPDPDLGPDEIVAAWWQAHPAAAGQRDLLAEICQGEVDLARMSVASGALRGLVTR